MMRVRLACVAIAAMLAGCATPPLPAGRPGAPVVQAPSLGLLSGIKVPEGHAPALQLAARGVQIFRCERSGNAFEWRFRQPEAELIDSQGRVVGRHGANFSFEHIDGSRLLGTVAAHDRAPTADTLPWLLLSAKGFGKGEFAGVSYVQRVNTTGGMPPAGCGASQANQLLRVDFRADFIFCRPHG